MKVAVSALALVVGSCAAPLAHAQQAPVITPTGSEIVTCVASGVPKSCTTGAIASLGNTTVQAATKVYAGPVSGSAAIPTFRPLVTSDVPTGTSGQNIPLLNGINAWSAKQSYQAASSGSASINVPQGVIPSSPSDGDEWGTPTGIYRQTNGVPLPMSQRVFDVTAYGATGNGSTDDSAAIKATFSAANASGGSATILFPAHPNGGYFYCPSSSPTLNVTAPNITIRGEGRASEILPCQTSGDFIHVYPLTGSNLIGFQMQDIAVYSVGANPTSGALLHLENVNTFKVMSSEFEGYYGGIFCDGCVHGDIVGTNIMSDANFTSLAAGSYLFKGAQSAFGTYAQEVHISGADWRGQNGNFFLDKAILITGADGIWFNDLHAGFARYGMYIAPATNTTQLTSVIIRNGYLDTTSINGLAVVQPSASYSATFGLHDLHFSNAYNSGQDMLNWFLSTSGSALPSNLYIGQILQAGYNGVNIGLGQNINLLPGWSIIAPGYSAPSTCAGSGLCDAILINGASTGINIGAGTAIKGASTYTNCGLQVTSAVTAWLSQTIRNQGMAFGVCDSSTTTYKSVGTVLNW